MALYSVLFLALSAITLTFFTTKDMRKLPNDLDALTKASIKPQLLDRNGRVLTVTYVNQWNAHDVMPLHQMPTFLQQSFILAEDKRFYEHAGIDWLARVNAVLQNILALRGVRGASTISEQTVRMIHQRPRTLWSRWLEGWEARELEQKFDKASILEFYLNQVPYTAQRRGVQQAARYYFDRDVSTLNQKEILALAVMVRAPSRFDLYKSKQRIEGRLDTLLDRAQESGLIDNRSEVADTELALTRPANLPDVSHFARHVYAKTRTEGHKITTTLDVEHQKFAQELLDQGLDKLGTRQVDNAAMIVLDHHSDEVLVWAVGSSGVERGSAYDTVLAKRQPGSTLKPFVYASALQKGWTAATIISDSPLNEGVGQGVHSYRNYSNKFYGNVSLRSALGNSLNIPAIKAAQYVGVEPLLDRLNKLGIEDLNLRSVDYGNGIALGNGEISLHSLVGAYAALARKGTYRSMKTTRGQATSRTTKVFSNEVTSIVGSILSDPDARSMEFGRGGTLHIPVQTAVKTGTSNDYRDAWVVGYNHRYVVGVWMGNLSNEPMDRVTGSAGPAQILRSMFAELNRGGDTHELYMSRKLVSFDVCIDSGVLAQGDCPARQEWFSPENTPSIKAKAVMKEHFAITQPIDQMLVARDPRIPDESEAIDFKLNNGDGVTKVDWFVNDDLIASTVSTHYSWPLKVGKHIVRARVFHNGSLEPIVTQGVSMIVK